MREYEQIDMKDKHDDYIKVPYSVIRKLQDIFGNRNMLFYYCGCKLGNGNEGIKIYLRELSQNTVMHIEDCNFDKIHNWSDQAILCLYDPRYKITIEEQESANGVPKGCESS